MRVDPLRQFDMSPFNDGAGALLISRHRVKDAEPWFLAFERCNHRLWNCARHSRTYSAQIAGFFPATRLAAKRAYTEAGLDLRNWQRTLAPLILEHHDAFVPLTLMNLEDLQLFNSEHEVISFSTIRT